MLYVRNIETTDCFNKNIDHNMEDTLHVNTVITYSGNDLSLVHVRMKKIKCYFYGKAFS